MKKILMMFVAAALLTSCAKTDKKNETSAQREESTAAPEKEVAMNTEDIYQFKVEDLYGTEFDFSSLKGKKIMVVNTASECGLTPQYADLQKLYDTYKEQNFVIVGFPANNFGGQEPGSNAQIASFCKENYGLRFPMMSKISVKGEDMHEVYHFLTEKSRNPETLTSARDFNSHFFKKALHGKASTSKCQG